MLRRILHALGLVTLGVTTVAAATSRGSFAGAPYYDGKVPAGLRSVACVGVAFHAEPGALEPTPTNSPALAALVDSLALELGRLGLGGPLVFRKEGAPEVDFGCRRGGVDAAGQPLAPSEIDVREPRRMAFVVEGPRKAWREDLRAAADSVNAVIVVTVRFGEYWVRQADLKGSKNIELGTGRAMPIQWLTSLDDPVQVLQLTGALVASEGRVLRVGAEALTARRTGMAASVLGAQEILTEEDLQSLLATRTDGDPVWRIALRQLVAGLQQAGNPPR